MSVVNKRVFLFFLFLGAFTSGIGQGADDVVRYGNQELKKIPDNVGDFIEKSFAKKFTIDVYIDDIDFLTSHVMLPDGRMLVGEKGGKLFIQGHKEKIVLGTLPVDTKGARGLLNVILHPDFDKNQRIIVYYSVAKAPDTDKQRVSSFSIKGDQLNLGSEIALVSGIFGAEGYEQGGGLAIDNQRNLYIGVGDGGFRAGQMANTQYTPTNYFATCLTNGNGKILRIGLDGSIPRDNPLVGKKLVTDCGPQGGDSPFKRALRGPRQDIWAWGVRNPWRLWMDPKTNYLWFVDDGDITNEEVNVATASGQHFGWPWREGAQGHPRSSCKKVTPGQDCVEPAYFCKHGPDADGIDGGCQSMGGGLAIDDRRWPEAERGKFYFGDCSNGWIWNLAMNKDRTGIVPRSRQTFARVGGMIVDMDLEGDGSLYIGVLELPPEKSRIVKISPRSTVAH